MAVTNTKSVVLCLALITMLLVSHVDASSRMDPGKLKEKQLLDACLKTGVMCGFGKNKTPSFKEKAKTFGEKTKDWFSKTFSV